MSNTPVDPNQKEGKDKVTNKSFMDKLKDNTNFIMFFVVVLIVVIVALVTEHRIIKGHESNLKALTEKFEIINMTMLQECSLEEDAISSLNETMHLDSTQCKILKSVLLELETKHGSTHRDYRVGVEEIRMMLDAQSVKVQNEYESLQIWCGLLTIVFLVFSFYSVFKADNIVRQGNEALSDISKIKREGRESVDGISEQVNKKITEFIDSSKTTLAKEKKETTDEINENKDKIIRLLTEKETDIGNKIEDSFKGNANQLNEIIKQENEKLDKKMADHNKKIVEIDQQLKNMESRLASMKNAVSTIDKMAEVFKSFQQMTTPENKE